MSASRDRSAIRQRPAMSLVASLAVVAVLGALVVVLVAPLVAHGQAGPIREPALPEATATPNATSAESTEAGGQVQGEGGPSAHRPPSRRTTPVPTVRRPRPEAAPVVLLPTATATATAPPEPAPRRTQRAARPPTRPSRQPTVSRSWPLAPGTFELSQPFGCVPQLLGYYPVVPGCPAERPSLHNGLDLAATQGTPIYAAASGVVTVAGRDRDDGIANTRLVIQHDGANEGYATEYYHWIKTYVEPGDYVRAGDLIAEVGSVGYSTGPHLHFTVVDAETNQAIDPSGWLPPTSSRSTLADARVEDDRLASGTGRIVVTDYIPPTPTPSPRSR